MGRYKRPGAMVKCEHCNRSFPNERAVGQHLISKAPAPAIDQNKQIPSTVHNEPPDFATQLVQPVVLAAVDSDAKPVKRTGLSRQDDPPSKFYHIMSLPGKGQGLIATQDIPEGTRILSEEPLFRLPRSGLNQPAVERLIERGLNALPKESQQAFLSLHNNTPDSRYPLGGIAKTNALPLGVDASEGGLFPEASRINHSCLPNCQHTWNVNTEEETIHAVRHIPKDEEITISYADTGTFETRRRHLKQLFGFDCACELCGLSETARAVSDYRQSEIQRLDALLGDGLRLLLNPDRCLEDAQTLVTLLEAEKITDSRVPRAYYDAFQIAIAHGDQARAKVLAGRAHKARLCCEGDDSPLTAHVKSLAAKPATHRLFGTSNRWKQSEKMIPKNLEAEKFEVWLWKRNG